MKKNNTVFNVACHEAGHVLAAHLMGLKIKTAYLGKTEGNSAGMVGVDKLTNWKRGSFGHFSDYLMGLLVFSLSGHAGEIALSSIFIKDNNVCFKPFVWTMPGSSSFCDMDIFKKLKDTFFAEDNESFQLSVKEAIKETVKIFSNVKNRLMLLALASLLSEKKSLTNKQVNNLLDQMEALSIKEGTE